MIFINIIISIIVIKHGHELRNIQPETSDPLHVLKFNFFYRLFRRRNLKFIWKFDFGKLSNVLALKFLIRCTIQLKSWRKKRKNFFDVVATNTKNFSILKYKLNVQCTVREYKKMNRKPFHLLTQCHRFFFRYICFYVHHCS